MNCEKCQELLSDYLEGSLAARDRLLTDAHLEECLRCSGVREELESIVFAARECREHLYSPPDSRALWLRISNTIEGERALRPAAAAALPRGRAARGGGLAQLWARRWELTLPQMATAVSALVVGVALVTAMATHRFMSAETAIDQQRARDTATETARRRGDLSGVSYPGGFVRQQQTSINYWQQRVEQRKANWHPRMRESFDRSVSVLDQAVVESLDELQRNPHDEVSEETLNTALRDKLELLREFSEQ